MNLAKPFVACALATLAACGSSSSSKSDAPAGGDGRTTAPVLTVKNYLSWCSVSVDGGATSTAASQSVTASSSGAITLVATPASSSFEIDGNMWHHTDGDTGSGDPGTTAGSGVTETSTAKITIGTSSKCVWVCCPFSSPAGTGCNVAEQCN